jgi:hypothetical protein
MKNRTILRGYLENGKSVAYGTIIRVEGRGTEDDGAVGC